MRLVLAKKDFVWPPAADEQLLPFPGLVVSGFRVYGGHCLGLICRYALIYTLDGKQNCHHNSMQLSHDSIWEATPGPAHRKHPGSPIIFLCWGV